MIFSESVLIFLLMSNVIVGFHFAECSDCMKLRLWAVMVGVFWIL